MCNAYHHFEDCRCGWGGEGHKGRPGPRSAGLNDASVCVSQVRAWESWGIGHARSEFGEPLTHPIRCMICGAFIFFHTNGYGDVVFFDQLGWPWPKHGCLSSEAAVRSVAVSSSLKNHPLRALAELHQRPLSISNPTDTPLVQFDSSLLGKTVSGVVMASVNRSSWRVLPLRFEKRMAMAVEVHLWISRTHFSRIFLLAKTVPLPGEAIKASLERRHFQGKAVLIAEKWEFIGPPASRMSASQEQVAGSGVRRITSKQYTPPATTVPAAKVFKRLKRYAAAAGLLERSLLMRLREGLINKEHQFFKDYEAYLGGHSAVSNHEYDRHFVSALYLLAAVQPGSILDAVNCRRITLKY